MTISFFRRYIFLLPFAAAGFLIVRYTTSGGMGLNPDSTDYIALAESLLKGNGFVYPSIPYTSSADFEPQSHFPPIYPLVLAAFGLAGIHPYAAARLVALLLFPGNILLTGAILYRFTQSRILAALAAYFFLFAPDMIVIHTVAVPEPLFVFLTLFLVLFLALYLESEKIAFLVAASIACSGAILCRYAGIPWLPTGVALLLVDSRFPRGQRIRSTGIFLTLVLLLTSIWFARNWMVAETMTNRSLSYHPITVPQLLEGLRTAGRWFLPKLQYLEWKGVAVLAVLAGAVVLVFRKELEDQGLKGLLKISSLYAGAYVIFLLISISFAAFGIPLDWRILSPAYALLLLFVIAAIPVISKSYITNRWKKLSSSRLLKTASLMLLIGYLAFFARRGIIYSSLRPAQGYASTAWRNSPVLLAVRQINPQVPIFTNGFDVIYFYTGRLSKSLPARPAPANPAQWEQEIHHFVSLASKKGAIVIFFDNIPRDFLLSEKELIRTSGFELVRSFPDGKMYQARPP